MSKPPPYPNSLPPVLTYQTPQPQQRKSTLVDRIAAGVMACILWFFVYLAAVLFYFSFKSDDQYAAFSVRCMYGLVALGVSSLALRFTRQMLNIRQKFTSESRPTYIHPDTGEVLEYEVLLKPLPPGRHARQWYIFMASACALLMLACLVAATILWIRPAPRGNGATDGVFAMIVALAYGLTAYHFFRVFRGIFPKPIMVRFHVEPSTSRACGPSAGATPDNTLRYAPPPSGPARSIADRIIYGFIAGLCWLLLSLFAMGGISLVSRPLTRETLAADLFLVIVAALIGAFAWNYTSKAAGK